MRGPGQHPGRSAAFQRVFIAGKLHGVARNLHLADFRIIHLNHHPARLDLRVGHDLRNIIDAAGGNPCRVQFGEPIRRRAGFQNGFDFRFKCCLIFIPRAIAFVARVSLQVWPSDDVAKAVNMTSLPAAMIMWPSWVVEHLEWRDRRVTPAKWPRNFARSTVTRDSVFTEGDLAIEHANINLPALARAFPVIQRRRHADSGVEASADIADGHADSCWLTARAGP